jgi:hypothetical protein
MRIGIPHAFAGHKTGACNANAEKITTGHSGKIYRLTPALIAREKTLSGKQCRHFDLGNKCSPHFDGEDLQATPNSVSTILKRCLMGFHF